MIISYCKFHIIAFLSMNKSRLEKPSILQEAVFIFAPPAPSTASLRGTYYGTSVSENDVWMAVTSQILCSFCDTYTSTLLLVLF